MAFGANTSKWYFVGDSTSLERSTRRSEDALERLNRTGKSSFGGLSSAASLLTGALGVGGLAYGLKSLTDAAKESELAAGRMRTQFDALGLSFEQHREHVDDVIQAQSRLAALDDEELSDSFTTILRVTGDVNRSLELNALAADIARGKQIDLATAGELVAKVAGGNIGILSRYGIAIEKGADATEALGELQRLFAGQAEAYGSSNAGAAERAAVAWENAREELGARLLPLVSKLATFIADDLIPAVSSFAGWVDGLVDRIGGWKVAAGFILSGLFASRILAIVEAVKALTVATAAAGATQAAAAGTALTAWGKLGTFLKVGLPAALAVGLVAMRDKVREEAPGVVEKIRTNIYGELTDEESRRILENNGVKLAASLSDGMAEELSKLGPQVFVPAWEDVQRVSKIAALDTGDESGDAFIEGVRERLKAAFPPAVVGALAPTWADIERAAEAAGIDTANAFTAGLSRGWTGTPFPGSAPGTVTPAPGGVPSLVFPLPSDSRFSRGGGPDAHRSGGRGANWQSLNAVDIMVKAGTPVLAVEAGVVESVSGRDPGQGTVTTSSGAVTFGYSVTIKSKANRYFYTHLDDVVVQANDPVKAGQVIGLVATWDRGGSHVHFAVERGDPTSIYNAPATQGFGTYPGPGYTPPTAPSTSTSTSSTPEKRPTTSFPGIAGISDRLRARFDEVNQPEGEALDYDPKTGKFRSVKVGPELKAMKKLADHIRTKVLPPLQKQINALRKRIRAMSKNKKHDKTLLATLKNKLAAYVDERNEIMAFWREVIDTWKELKENAAEDDDTGEEPTAAYDFSGPVGAAPGLPGHSLPTDPADSQDSSLDLQAELDQANARAAVNARSAAYNAAGLASLVIGTGADGAATVTAPGGGTVIVQSLVPPSHEWIARLAGYVSEGAAGQGFQMATAENLGV